MEFVTDQIAIGNSNDGYNEKSLIENGITATVNASIDLEMPIYDLIIGKGGEKAGGLVCGPGNTVEKVDELVEQSTKLLEVHPRILIYCHSGLDRSPLVAAAVLSEINKVVFDRAWKEIQNKLEPTSHKVTFTSDGVKQALLDIFDNWSKQMGSGMQLVSIVVPCVGGDDDKVKKTERCLHSIMECSNYKPIEIIGINDGTPNDVNLMDVLETYCDHIIVHDRNEGVAKSRSDGNNKASGDIICQIDNDTVFFPNWLPPLVGSLNKMSDLAIVAPLFTCNTEYFAQRIKHMEYKSHFEVDQVGTACMLYWKTLIGDIGNFDAKLFNLWEDKDFCYRLTTEKCERTGKPIPKNPRNIIEQRHKVAINPQVIVYHSGHVDPETGDWVTDPNNTRSLPFLQQTTKIAKSMEIMYDRWGVKHGKYDEMVGTKSKIGKKQ